MGLRIGSGFAAAVLAASSVVAVLPSAHAATSIERTGAQTYADLMAIQAATRSGWTSGYVLRAHGSSEGGWSWTETFDATTRTIKWRPSRGPVRLNTPTTAFVAIPDTPRSAAIRRLVGRPKATWTKDRIAGNPDYWFNVGHEFGTFRADDADPTPNKDVADSATVTTDADGTRHWVVRSHRWWGARSIPNPDMVLTTDPRGRLVAQGSPADGSTISYAPPTVSRPARSRYILGSTYARAEAAVTLRHRVRKAARAVGAAAGRRAAAEHLTITASLIRAEARRTVAALPASLAPVAWRKVRAGADLYGWNPFTKTRVVYRVRPDGTQARVTKVG
jgi:hypothetical protein